MIGPGNREQVTKPPTWSKAERRKAPQAPDMLGRIPSLVCNLLSNRKGNGIFNSLTAGDQIRRFIANFQITTNSSYLRVGKIREEGCNGSSIQCRVGVNNKDYFPRAFLQSGVNCCRFTTSDRQTNNDMGGHFRTIKIPSGPWQ